MTIYIDPRKGSGGDKKMCTPGEEHEPGCLVPFIQQYIVPASLVEESYMDAGDFAFAGNGPDGTVMRIGGEIKHAPDVLQCIDDGRFAGSQLLKMQRDYDHYWLVLEDDLKPEPSSGMLLRRLPPRKKGKKGRRFINSSAVRTEGSGYWAPVLFGNRRMMKYSDVVKWLFSMEVIGGLKVWRTKSRDETAQWIVALYHWWNDKRFDQHKAIRVFDDSQGKRPMYVHPDVQRIAKVAARLDGVGYERGISIGYTFDSIHEFINAPVVDLRIQSKGTKGVGKKLARSIYEQIRRKKMTKGKGIRK